MQAHWAAFGRSPRNTSASRVAISGAEKSQRIGLCHGQVREREGDEHRRRKEARPTGEVKASWGVRSASGAAARATMSSTLTCTRLRKEDERAHGVRGREVLEQRIEQRQAQHGTEHHRHRHPGCSPRAPAPLPPAPWSVAQDLGDEIPSTGLSRSIEDLHGVRRFRQCDRPP